MATNLQIFNEKLTDNKMQRYLEEVLGSKKGQFVSNIATLVANNTNLQKCEPYTLIYAGIKATALDLPLDPNLGFAYVIPYNRKGTTEAQFQIGYKGFIQLAMRSGQFKTINVRDVRDGEITGEDFISGEINFVKLPDDKRLNAPIIGYVAYFKLINGFEKTQYMTVKEIEAHGKKYSKTFSSGSGLWIDNFEAMAIKTALKLMLSKYAPMSVEIQNAIKYDQAIVSENKVEYPDNEQQFISSDETNKAATILSEALGGGENSVEDAEAMDVSDDVDEEYVKECNKKIIDKDVENYENGVPPSSLFYPENK